MFRRQFVLFPMIRCGRGVQWGPYDHSLHIHEKVVASASPSGSGRFHLCVYLVGTDIEASILGLRKGSLMYCHTIGAIVVTTPMAIQFVL